METLKLFAETIRKDGKELHLQEAKEIIKKYFQQQCKLLSKCSYGIVTEYPVIVQLKSITAEEKHSEEIRKNTKQIEILNMLYKKNYKKLENLLLDCKLIEFDNLVSSILARARYEFNEFFLSTTSWVTKNGQYVLYNSYINMYCISPKESYSQPWVSMEEDLIGNMTYYTCFEFACNEYSEKISGVNRIKKG